MPGLPGVAMLPRQEAEAERCFGCLVGVACLEGLLVPVSGLVELILPRYCAVAGPRLGTGVP